jgi:acetylornithine deacetylase
MTIFELTKKLIDIPSVTGEEAEVGEFLAQFLHELSYNVELQNVEADRSNIIATTSSEPHLVLSTHMDTVPPYIRSSEDSEYIHGRGACDAKGIIAAQIFAAESLRAEGIDNIGLLFTVDEEMGSLGAAVANEHPLASQCRYLINGEPTDNLLAIGTKGSLRVRLATQGVAAHSAYPERGDSAVEKLLDVLASIRQVRWPNDQFFGETTCNIGVIRGGTRPNIIAAEAEALLQIRLTSDAGEIKNTLEETVAGRATIEYMSVHDPVRLISVDGLEQCVVRFTTDIPYLKRWGQPLLLGPGSIFQAHTAHERIAKDDLKRAVELYRSLVHSLSGFESREVLASQARS